MTGALPIRSVAVVGGGVVAACAALALARALPRSRVELIATPVPPDALADRLPTLWPSGVALFERLGLDERQMLSGGIAAPVLARAFSGWSSTGERWLCPEGEAVRVPGRGLLHQRWLRAGASAPFHDLFPAAALAEAGRFAPGGTASGWQHLDFALAFAPERLGAILAEGCRRAGVQVGAGAIARLEPASHGGWHALRLADGRRVEADLFVWAAGGALPEEEWRDWSNALPADRVTLAAGAGPALVDEYRAKDNGWSAQLVRPGSTIAMTAFASATERSADEAIALRPGRSAQGWTGNLLRLGDAAVQPGPLGLGGFTLAAHHLLLALELLPGRDMEPLLVAEYNRRATLRAEHVRDFLAAHYLAGSRRRGPFWMALVRREPPTSLAALLAQFRRRGHLPHRDEENVPADAWRAVLLGQGIRPKVANPVAMGADPEREREALTAARHTLSAAAAALPVR